MKNQTAPPSVIAAIRDTGLISILRGVDSGKICDVVDVMGQNGIRLVEVTLDTPDALQSIQKLSRTFSRDSSTEALFLQSY